MRVLAGDIGGTNSRLGLCTVTGDRVSRDVEAVRPSAGFDCFADVVQAFLSEHGADVHAACFGLPGPVRGRAVQLTNLPWEVDADQLEQTLPLPAVSLINDLEANAYGLRTLDVADFGVLRWGAPDPGGNQGLVSAGTGLGQAGLCRWGSELIPFPTEGGHAEFGPKDALEVELLQYLQARFGPHISWERIVSGPGLANIYAFLRDRDPGAEPEWLREALADDDDGAVITSNGLSGDSELCRRALDMFMALYGAETGNFALKVLATGGIFLGGGIAPRLAEALPESGFLERFDDKGRMRELMEQIPISIVLNDKAALQGAALCAAKGGLNG